MQAWADGAFGVDPVQDAHTPLLAPGSLARDSLAMQAAVTLNQPATTETMLEASPKLPPALSSVYLQEQEHFDLRKLLVPATAVQLDVASLFASRRVKKSVVYTRLADGLDGLLGSITGTEVMNLAAIRTQAECEDVIRQFAGNDSPSLLIAVDIRSVGNKRLNSVRQTVDACTEMLQVEHAAMLTNVLRSEAQRLAEIADADEVSVFRGLEAAALQLQLRPAKCVVVCILVPAAWLHVRSVYPSLFLNGWDFLFLDSLTEAQGAVSASHWMRAACGLEEEGFPLACADTLLALNKRVLNSVVLGVTGIRSRRHFDFAQSPSQSHYVTMEPFYMSPQSGLATAADRLAALQTLEAAMGGHTLCSLVSNHFLALFSSADLAVHLAVFCPPPCFACVFVTLPPPSPLQTAAELCSSGRSTAGLTAELNSILFGYYEAFARELYSRAAAGYNLQSLFDMYTLYGSEDMLPLLHAFTAAALEDLFPLTLAAVADRRGAVFPHMTCAALWSWLPLPFLHHMRQVVSPALADGSASVAHCQSLLLGKFSTTFRLDGAFASHSDGLLVQLLLQSSARICGGDESVVLHALEPSMEHSTDARLSATERFASVYFRHCVMESFEVAKLQAWEAVPQRRALQSKLQSLANLERVGVVSDADLTAILSGLSFTPLRAQDDEWNRAAFDANSSRLLQALWNLLVVRLWTALCSTFGARAELSVVASSGLGKFSSTIALSPFQWAHLAVGAVKSLDPARHEGHSQEANPSHKVILNSVSILTPLVAVLFTSKSKKASAEDAARRRCVERLLPLVRRQAEIRLGSAVDKLLDFSMFSGAAIILPQLQEVLPVRDRPLLLAYLERVFTDSCSRLTAHLKQVLTGPDSEARLTVTIRSRTPDLRAMLEMLNNQEVGVRFPSAFCTHVLSQLYEVFLLSHPSVRPHVLQWFRREVSAQLDLAGTVDGKLVGLPAKFGDVRYVPHHFGAAMVAGVTEEFPTHPCLQCPLAHALYTVLSRARLGQADLPPASGLHSEYLACQTLDREVLSKTASHKTRAAMCGWFSCVEQTVNETALMEALVGDMCTLAVPPPDGVVLKSSEPLETLATLRLHYSRKGAKSMRAFMDAKLALFPVQVYLVTRAVQIRGREFVARVLHHPCVKASLGPWVTMFQLVFVIQTEESMAATTDVASASLIGQDHLSHLPFMWPRAIMQAPGAATLTAEEVEEATAFGLFYHQTVTVFAAAHRERERDGAVCGSQMLARSGWLEFLEEFGRGSDDSPARLRAKMFLFCVVAWVWFDKDEREERRCHAVADNLERIAVILNLVPREVRLLAAFADPQAEFEKDPARPDDVTRLFFQTQPLLQDDKRQRSVIMAMVAVTLGLPRESHVFHTHLFSPGSLHGTCGLATAYSVPIGGVHYDCGTVLQPANGTWTGREPLLDRGVFTSVLMPAQGLIALGLSLFPEDHPLCYGPVFSRFFTDAVGNAENFGRAAALVPRNAEDWLRNFVWGRVQSAWIVQSNMCVLPVLVFACLTFVRV